MPSPLVEIFAPQRRGSDWAVAARIHLPQGQVTLLATAPQALVAAAYAKATSLFAYRQNAPEVGLDMERTEVRAPEGRTHKPAQVVHSVLADRITFRQYKDKIASTLPAVAPVLPLGVDKDALRGAVAVAARPHEQPPVAPTADLPKAVTAAAAIEAATAALTVTDANEDAAANMLCALQAAYDLLCQALSGLDDATEQIADIADAAADGDGTAEEAFAYIAVLYGALDLSTPYMEQAPNDWAGPDYEIDEDVSGYRIAGPEPSRDFGSVGAGLADLLARLDALSQVRAGYRTR